MGEVVSLDRHRPHASGQARCTACEHEWVAVAPVGTNWLVCPSCKTARGLYRHPLTHGGADHDFRCSCGCDVFGISIEGNSQPRVMCVSCGRTCDPWASIDT